MSHLNELMELTAGVQLGITVTLPTGFTSGSAIKDAYPYPPADPSGLACPFFYNQYEGGRSDVSVVGQQVITDTVLMSLCVMTTESQALSKETFQILCMWRDAVLAAFAAKIQLGGYSVNQFVITARITKISAFENITIGSVTYRGMTFTLTVQEYYPTVESP